MTNSMGDTGAERIASASPDSLTVVELLERPEKAMEGLRPVFEAILEAKEEDSRE